MSDSPEVTLGAALKTRIGFIAPQRAFKYTENNLVSGQYRAIGIDMQGISPKQLEDLQANLQNTQTQLEANNTDSLTKHDVVGIILQAGVQGYMAMTYATDRIAAQSAGVAYHRQPSYGSFGTEMEASYLMSGEPNQVTFTGVVMDIDRLASNVEEKQNCYEGWVAFNRSSGMRNSAYEHQIPEQLFSTETEQVEGVSTAKALAIAMAEGQRIYTFTSDNAEQLANITIDEGSRSEIQSALSLGLEVTVHQSPISVNGWTGSGYTILDAEFGVGAYKISGGGSGGILLVAAATLAIIGSFIVSAILATSLLSILVSGFLSWIAMKSYMVNISDLMALNDSGKISDEQFDGSVKFLSVLTTIGGVIGMRGKLKGDFAVALDQAIIAGINFFVKTAAITAHQ